MECTNITALMNMIESNQIVFQPILNDGAKLIIKPFFVNKVTIPYSFREFECDREFKNTDLTDTKRETITASQRLDKNFRIFTYA